MTETLYRLDVYDTANAKQAELIGDTKANPVTKGSGFSFLAYRKQVNAPGMLQFGLNGDHPLFSSLADKWKIDVWRKPSGSIWARDFATIYRQPEYTYRAGPRAALYCPGLMHILGWRDVLWYAGTASRSAFTSAKGETVMKTLVSYNAAASATTGNGRIRDGAITGLTVEADAAGGNTIDWFCAYENLLDSLQKLAHVAGGDFDLVKTSATAWQFRWGVWSYVAGTLTAASDRSASVKFALERGNMANPVYRERRIEERTVAIVGGQGEGADRAIAIRTGANYNATTNNIEMFVNASDADTTAGLNARGDHKLSEAQAANEFDFDCLESPQTRYGVDYFLGDLVSAVNPFTGATLTLKVRGVSISLDAEGKETIKPEFGLV